MLCIGCKQEEATKLECPTCRKLGIPGSFFHDQACFQKNCKGMQVLHGPRMLLTTQPTHKSLHSLLKAKTSSEDADLPPHMRGFKYKGEFRPKYPISARREVPVYIPTPDYADHPEGFSQIESVREKSIQIFEKDEIEIMRKVCRMTREVLEAVASHIKVGVTTEELDAICHEECIKRNSYPSPLNYNGFPKSVCTSVNDVVCHGIPDQYQLKDGDIINIDVSLYWNGHHGDCNETYAVGTPDERSLELMRTTRKALDEAIAICAPGVPFQAIGNKIHDVVEAHGFAPVRTYTGHGISARFHTGPNITHYRNSKSVPGRMQPGMIFSIEPMINASMSSGVTHLNDNWTALTLDGARSAQSEDVILITETGAEILTRIPASAKKNLKKKNKKAKAAAAAASGQATPEEGEAEVEGDEA